MNNAWIIFVIYLLVKVSVLGARHVNKQDYHSYNQTTYSSADKDMPDWFIPLVKRINEEGNDVARKIETLEKGNKSK